MSFGIVRIQKVKRQGVTGIGIHNQRKKEKSNTNPDIDWERTADNYALEGESVSFSAEVTRRLEGVSGSRWGTIRKDAVVLAEALVTSDSAFFASLPPEKQKAFFAQSLDFLKRRYGEETIFSAVVHMDEATPHMHVSFVPLKDGKLSAKTLFSREALSDLQTTFFEQVGKQWGLQRGEKRVIKRQHIATPDFKRLTAAELDRALDREISAKDTKKKWVWSAGPKIETAEGVALRLNQQFLDPLIAEVQALQKSEAQWKEEAQLKDEAYQRQTALEKGLSSALIQKLRRDCKALSKKLKQEREELEERYKKAIFKLLNPLGIVPDWKEYHSYLDKLQLATPTERTVMVKELCHAEQRFEAQELFYEATKYMSLSCSGRYSTREAMRDSMLKDWDRATSDQREKMEQDARAFVAQGRSQAKSRSRSR